MSSSICHVFLVLILMVTCIVSSSYCLQSDDTDKSSSATNRIRRVPSFKDMDEFDPNSIELYKNRANRQEELTELKSELQNCKEQFESVQDAFQSRKENQELECDVQFKQEEKYLNLTDQLKACDKKLSILHHDTVCLNNWRSTMDRLMIKWRNRLKFIQSKFSDRSMEGFVQIPLAVLAADVTQNLHRNEKECLPYLDSLEQTISSALNLAVLTSEPVWIEHYMPEMQKLIATGIVVIISLVFYYCRWRWYTCLLFMFATISYIWEYARLLKEDEMNVKHDGMVYLEKCEKIKVESYYQQFLLWMNSASDSECKRYYMQTFGSSIFNTNPLDPCLSLCKRTITFFIKEMGFILGKEFSEFFGQMSYVSMIITLVCFTSGFCFIVYKVFAIYFYYWIFRPKFSHNEYDVYRKVQMEKLFASEMAKKRQISSQQAQIKKLKRCHSLGSLNMLSLT